MVNATWKKWCVRKYYFGIGTDLASMNRKGSRGKIDTRWILLLLLQSPPLSKISVSRAPPNLGYTCCTCLMLAEVRVLGRVETWLEGSYRNRTAGIDDRNPVRGSDSFPTPFLFYFEFVFYPFFFFFEYRFECIELFQEFFYRNWKDDAFVFFFFFAIESSFIQKFCSLENEF